MRTYERAGLSDFSSILEESGRVYHLRGDYAINEDKSVYLPVNRSYAPLYAEDTLCTNPDAPYVKDRVIHDEVHSTSALKSREKVISIAGKELLFLAVADTKREDVVFSPQLSENMYISAEAKRLGDRLVKELDRMKLSKKLGILGSHQTGVNGTESDLDLIMWVPRLQRDEVVIELHEIFSRLGYSNPNNTNRLSEYSARIANLGGLSVSAGAYLASQRLRWISPQGVSTSLQCLHEDYGHGSTKEIVDTLLSEGYESINATQEKVVDVLFSSDPYNFPRRWDLDVAGESSLAIGFDWAHQGMGVPVNNVNGSEKFVVRAQHIRARNGKDLYVLSEKGHSILPLSIV